MYKLRYRIDAGDVEIEDFVLELCEYELIEKIVEFIDAEMESSLGCLKEKVSCYQVITHLLKEDLLSLDYLFDAYEDQLHEAFKKHAEDWFYESGKYYEIKYGE